MESIEESFVDASAEERQQGIVALLERRGGMSVAALAVHFHCSTATVRRDLARIEETGVALERHHGSLMVSNSSTLFWLICRYRPTGMSKRAISSGWVRK